MPPKKARFGNRGKGKGGKGKGKGGSRFAIPVTRAIIANIHSGKIDNAPTTKLPLLNLTIPLKLHGVDDAILNPRSTWSNHDDYDAAARGLAQKFVENFRKFNVDDDITNAGPQLN